MELHFQINYTKVRLDGQTMTFWDSGAPSLIVVGDGKLKPSFRHGWISDMMDQKRPSLILDFCEEGGEATRYFATVLVPVKPGKHANLRGLSVDKSGFNMELNGQTYHFDIKREKRYECRK